MRESTLIERFINWLRSLFINKEKAKENSDIFKRREMCRRAIQGGLCPQDCDICAWNTERIIKESDNNDT